MTSDNQYQKATFAYVIVGHGIFLSSSLGERRRNQAIVLVEKRSKHQMKVTRSR